MDTREAQVRGGDQREEYKAPQIAILGKVEDLTHGTTTPTPDVTNVGSGA